VALVNDWRVFKRVIFSQKYISPKINLTFARYGMAVAEHEIFLSSLDCPSFFPRNARN
jgi:hypothetical protein